MLSGKIGVTAARNTSDSMSIACVKQWAIQLDAIYIERPHNLDVQEVMHLYNLTALIVGEKNGPRIYNKYGSFAYHPGMAVLRILQLQRGHTEHLPKALNIMAGSRVLDATLGLAADAAIAAHVVGDTGCVVGLEASLLLHFAVSYGLKNYSAENKELVKALRRIKTVQTFAADYLKQCRPGSFDVVYFDPMFRHPVVGAKGMEALRPLSYEASLDENTLKLALQIAPRVVIKERSENILKQYGCTEFIGGKYSRIKFGVIKGLC